MGELELAAGRVVGTQIKGVSRFAGVPYGAAPIGDRRWRPAAPAGPWPGVRDATSFGPSAWQGDLTGNPALKVLDLVDTNPPSEDCLSVNVWTPEISRSVRLPVLVWIHGGASVVGSPAMPLYDGSVLARDQQLVVVTVGFRLGVFGFFAHDLVDSLGNQALTDISLALDWVQQNISAFGGDSSNVTVAGES
jgi:para-nitrobenzyl esterase